MTKVIAFISLVLLMLAVACSSEGATSPVLVAEATYTPYGTYIPELMQTSSPSPVGLATEAPALGTATGSNQQSHELSTVLQVREIPEGLPKYDRDDWKHWTDEDKDCQNTRHEVLIQESLYQVTFKTEKQCQVSTGEWLDPYTATIVRDATKLDVDHMVPLKNAHDSGAWGWDKNKKAAFANEMDHDPHLIAVTASANRSKGAAGPEKWKPVDKSYWCEYAISWVEIKVRWDLSATNAEWKALQDMIGTCDNPPSVTTAAVMNQLPIATASPALPVGTASGFGEIQISNIECNGKPEIVVIENSGKALQDMTDWTIEDEGAKHTYRFDGGFLLKPGTKVELLSGGSGKDTSSVIYWNMRAVWNNDGDTASLFNQAGELMSKMECS
jgi:hypothetical protein